MKHFRLTSKTVYSKTGDMKTKTRTIERPDYRAGKRALTVLVPEATHRDLRTALVRRGQSFQSWALDIINAELIGRRK